MIEHWASYSLGDFLMFSPASYFRRYELVNTELWPLHLMLLLLAVGLTWLLIHRRTEFGQWIAIILAGVWMLVAGFFFYRHYAQINLAAKWISMAFVCQALMLLVCGIMKPVRERLLEMRSASIWHPGMLLLFYSILVHPLVGLLAGRSLRGIEWFGVAPDPTAMATLGILLTGFRAAAWPLLLIPFAWCGLSALTYLAMGYPYGVIPLVLVSSALVATLMLRVGSHSSNLSG